MKWIYESHADLILEVHYKMQYSLQFRVNQVNSINYHNLIM